MRRRAGAHPPAASAPRVSPAKAPRSRVQANWRSRRPVQGRFPVMVSLDLEATGLSPAIDHVIEIGAVKFRGSEVIDRYQTLVNPGLRLPGMIRRLTGINDADLAAAPRLRQVLPQLREFIGDADLLAHGAGYDVSFLHEALEEEPGRRLVFDTIDVARVVLPAAPAYSLGGLCDHLGLEHPRPHHALEDAEATYGVFLELVRRAEDLPEPVLRELRDLTTGSSHSLRTFFHEIVLEDPQVTSPEPAVVAPVAVEREPLPWPGSAGLAALLGPGGALAAEPGWELRETQVEMCRAVAQAFERGQSLVVEAGTGTGKSLAYLLPSLAWAAAREERVCVSTNTINLQEQLLHKDLPLAARLLGIPLRAVLLKGRSHYLSRLRWQQLVLGTRMDAGEAPGLEGVDASELLIFKLKLAVWLGWTRTGDRDELRFFGQEERLWRSVASEWSDCRSGACLTGPAACFYHLSRRRAEAVDVVVVNHALLLADAFNEGPNLPLARHLVIDEAHHLEEAATKGLTEEVREDDLLGLLAIAGAAGTRGSASMARVHDGVCNLFDSLRDLCHGLFGSESGREVRLDQRTLADPLFAPVSARVAQLRRALPAMLPDEQAVAGSRLTRLVEMLGPEPANEVTWVAFNRDARATLKRAPVEVAEVLRTSLFADRETIVATSATLALNGSFEYFRRRTGMPQAGLFEMVLESPFDFLNQALLCIPEEVGAPGDQGYEEALLEVIERVALDLGGRTLVLFTSNEQLHRVSGELRLRLEPQGIEILAQVRGASRRTLVEQFAARSTTVLCGTSSFWEGVDLPGDTLSCVVIARLPFRPPGDPVLRARGERLKDPFLELALPEAVLRLKQGFGRLIRRSSDRGAVVIFDTRVSSRNYGKHFLDSLPECASFTGPASEVPAAVAKWVEGRR